MSCFSQSRRLMKFIFWVFEKEDYSNSEFGCCWRFPSIPATSGPKRLEARFCTTLKHIFLFELFPFSLRYNHLNLKVCFVWSWIHPSFLLQIPCWKQANRDWSQRLRLYQHIFVWRAPLSSRFCWKLVYGCVLGHGGWEEIWRWLSFTHFTWFSARCQGWWFRRYLWRNQFSFYFAWWC